MNEHISLAFVTKDQKLLNIIILTQSDERFQFKIVNLLTQLRLEKGLSSVILGKHLEQDGYLS